MSLDPQNGSAASPSLTQTTAISSVTDVEHGSKDAAVTGNRSIYTFVASPGRRKFLLLVMVLATFVSMTTNTILVPAMETLMQNFAASAAAVAATVAAYVAAEGVSLILCGPICDYVGRKPMYVFPTIVFIGASIGCVFAPSVTALAALRAVQGLAAGAFPAAGNGIRADAWTPSTRGMASAICAIPMMMGPIIGPVIGGFLVQCFGWRSVFYALAAYTAALLPVFVFLLPETHQHKVYMRMLKEAPEAAADCVEANDIKNNPPRYRAPWAPLLMLLERDIVLHVAVGLLTYCPGYAGMVLASMRLAGAPYNFSAGLVGVALLAAGAGAVLSAPVGGLLFDRAAAKHPHSFMARLAWNNFAALVFGPLSYTLLALGLWTQHDMLPGVLIAALFLLGVASGMFFPAMTAYLTCVKQHCAASVSCGTQGASALLSAGLVTAAVPGVHVMGSFGFFGLMGGLQVFVAVLAQMQIRRRME